MTDQTTQEMLLDAFGETDRELHIRLQDYLYNVTDARVQGYGRVFEWSGRWFIAWWAAEHTEILPLEDVFLPAECRRLQRILMRRYGIKCTGPQPKRRWIRRLSRNISY